MNTQSAIDLIKKAKNILCITKQEPSNDGITSLLALNVLANRLKKNCQVVAPLNKNKKLKFLPGYELIQESIPGSNEIVINLNQSASKITPSKDNQQITITPKIKEKIDINQISIHSKVANFDLIIVVDTPNLEALGKVFEEQVALFTNTPIISISSNPSHDGFGRVVLLSPQDSSSAEIIFNLLDDSEFSEYIDETMATILLTGIIATTSSFLERNTTPKSLKAASKLQHRGAHQSDIIENLFKKKPLATLKIWGRILGNLQQDENHKFAWSSLQTPDFELTGTSPDDIDDISDNLLRFTRESDIYALLFEDGSNVNIQIRTSDPSIDLTQLNKKFKGKIVDSGIDVTIQNKMIADIEGPLLETLKQFQKERYHLDPDLAIKTKNISRNNKIHTTHLDLHLKNKATSHKPKPPKSIPFSAPLQPHEKTGKIGDDGRDEKVKNQERKKTKSTYSPKKSGIPEWLKN